MDRAFDHGPYRTPGAVALPAPPCRPGVPPALCVGLVWAGLMFFVVDEPGAGILAVVTTLVALCAPAQSAGCELEGPMGSTPAPPPRRHVLVVDDDAYIRAGLRELLEYEGYLVATAANGAEALRELAHAGAPDVIVLDLEMPVMSGWQFCERTRSDPVLALVPVVVISAALVEAPSAPAVIGRLEKPIDIGELLALLSRCERGSAA